MELIDKISCLKTTPMGVDRIKKNCKLSSDIDAVEWCKSIILDKNTLIEKKGKNYYASLNNVIITVNSNSFTIITAHLN